MQQHSLVRQCNDRAYTVLIMDNVIDNHFIQHLEYKADLSFKRVDSETIDHLIEKDIKNESVLTEAEENKIKEIFTSLSFNKATATQTKALSPEDDPVHIVRPEFMRRMSEMQHMMTAMKGETGDLFKDSYNLIINTNHPIIARKMNELAEDGSKIEMATYLTQLALLNQNMLKGEELTNFIKHALEKV